MRGLGLVLILTGCTVVLDPGHYEKGQTENDASTPDMMVDDVVSPDTSDVGSCGRVCPTAMPVCNERTGQCMACTTTEGCNEDMFCDESTHTCEQRCDRGGSCESPSASLCDDRTGRCLGCGENADCDRIVDGGGNALKVCDDGECVHCTEESERGRDPQCMGAACNPETHVCTAHLRRSQTACQPCQVDDECIDLEGGNPAPHHCVVLMYQGEAHSPGGVDVGYCLRDRTEAGCEEPYTTLATHGDIRSCSIRQDLTTCEAILATTERCAGASCPIGGTCRTVGSLAGSRCTYACEQHVECPPGTNTQECVASGGDGTYCGGS